jgi:hypothetical protein
MTRQGILLAIACMLSVAISPCPAQTRTTQVLIGAANGSLSNVFETFGSEFNNLGEEITTSGSTTFTGLDRNGDEQTMNYSGHATASAEFGLLRTRAFGSVTNTYYNSDNPPLVDEYDTINPDGSPQSLQVAAVATFTDSLQFGGSLQPGYQARYFLRITGELSDPSAFHTVGITIAGNSERYFSPDDHVGYLLDFYNTQSYFVNGVTPQEVTLNVLSSFSISPQSFADGSTVEGEADFFNTTILERVELVDANGNLVPNSEWNVVSASGINYQVPEPTTGLLAGLALLGLFSLRRNATLAG